jgi:hypothetical protein
MSLSRFSGQYNAADFAYGINKSCSSLGVINGPNATGSAALTLAFGSTNLADGTIITPLATNAPILVGIGAASETVTPSAVSASTPLAYGTSSVTATFTYVHGNGDQVRSGTFGLQEAINYANTQGGGTVIVDPAWTSLGGTTTIVNAATLPSNGTVQILDLRGGQGVPLQTVTVLVPNSAVLTLYSAPTALIPAPGAGNMIDVVDMVVENSYLTAAFASGGAIQASYGSGVTTPATATIAATFLTSPTANQIVKVQGALASSLSSAVLNTAVNLAAATQNFTTGGGSLIVKVSYRVLTGF